MAGCCRAAAGSRARVVAPQTARIRRVEAHDEHTGVSRIQVAVRVGVLARVIGVAGLACDIPNLNVRNVFPRAARAVRSKRIGRNDAVLSVACDGAVRDRTSGAVPGERIRTVANESGATASLRPAVVRPCTAGIRVRVEDNNGHGKVARIQTAVHVRRGILISEVAFTAPETAHGNMGRMLAGSAGSICGKRIRRCAA